MGLLSLVERYEIIRILGQGQGLSGYDGYITECS